MLLPRFVLRAQKPTRSIDTRTHLDPNFGQPAKDLDLVLGDELGKGDEEAYLKGLKSVVSHAVPRGKY